MTEHICGICFQPASEHPEMGPDGEYHWPPLCCEGCPCGQWLPVENDA